jgi:carbonic anhydrase
MKTDQVLKRLSEGNARFVSDRLRGDLQITIKRESLIDVQEPYAIVLSCADSRVVPELIFDAGLGELFVVGVAGNVASRSSFASIEFAVTHLKTKLIIVMGHQNCGAVTAAINGADNGPYINQLLSLINPAIAASPKLASVNDVAKKNAELTAEVLKNKSKIIKNVVDKNEVKIVSAYYNLDSGKVDFML